MEIYLIRHTTPAVSPGLIYGRTDVSLAETFEAEKDALLPLLPAAPEVVYSSPAARCTRLAACIAPSYREDARLQELHFGQWEGKTWATVDRQASEAWLQDFVHNSPPAGESLQQMQNRVLDFWQELLQGPGQQVAVVTHAGVIRIILAALRDLPLSDCFSQEVSLGAVFQVSLRGPEKARVIQRSSVPGPS